MLCLIFGRVVLFNIIAVAIGFHPNARYKNTIKYDFSVESSVSEDYLFTNESPLKQLLVEFNCAQIDPDEISEVLFDTGTLSVSVEVLSEDPNFANDEKHWSELMKTKSWARALLRANIPSTFDKEGLKDILNLSFPEASFNISIVDVEDIDWVSHVQSTWKPQIIGDIEIRFPWHKEENQIKSKYQLVLEGGAAFGTGDHPTTRLCCNWLQECIQNSSDSLSVLDYGCGSAILGLAALRFGAGEAIGVDIDRDALLSAQNNCKINNLNMKLYVADDVSDNVTSEEKSIIMNSLKGNNNDNKAKEFSSVTEIINQQYDLTVANILAPILVSLAPQLASQTKKGGKIALAGLVSPQAEMIIKCYSEFFSDVKVENTENDWVLITGTRL